MHATDALLLVMPDGRRRVQYGSIFGVNGFRVLHAPSVSIALTRCQQEHPSLVVTDVLMRGMHGVDIARALRACAGPDRAPLIVGLVAPCFDDTEDAAESILFDHLLIETTPDVVVREVCDAWVRRRVAPAWHRVAPEGPLVLQ